MYKNIQHIYKIPGAGAWNLCISCTYLYIFVQICIYFDKLVLNQYHICKHVQILLKCTKYGQQMQNIVKPMQTYHFPCKQIFEKLHTGHTKAEQINLWNIISSNLSMTNSYKFAYNMLYMQIPICCLYCFFVFFLPHSMSSETHTTSLCDAACQKAYWDRVSAASGCIVT